MSEAELTVEEWASLVRCDQCKLEQLNAHSDPVMGCIGCAYPVGTFVHPVEAYPGT